MDTKQFNELKSILIDIQDKVTVLEKEQKKELLTPKEVCKILKICMRTYYNYVDESIFPQIQIGNKKYIRREEIEKLIETGKI